MEYEVKGKRKEKGDFMTELAQQKVTPLFEPLGKETYSPLQRYVLRVATPQSFFLQSATSLWVIHYLWTGKWALALSLFAVSRLITFVMARDIDYAEFGETTLGKLALLHLNPINAILQLSGLVFLVRGLLVHSTQSLLIGGSLILIGHMAGWEKIHPALKKRE